MAKVVSSEDNESLFFHEQRNTERHYRRLRKEPDELPQALRYFKYANLNPRIAAFLGKQDPRMLRKKRGENARDNDDEEGRAIEGGDRDGQLDTLKLPANLTRHPWAMGVGDVTDRNSMSPSNDIDDQQKFQFEEMTFAAPNILRELSDQIEHFLALFRDPEEESEVEQTTTTTTTTSSRKRLSGSPADLIPKRLAKLLCQDWDDVTANTEYTKRVWQTNAYRQLTAPVSTRPDVPVTADPGGAGDEKPEPKIPIPPSKSDKQKEDSATSGKEPKKKIKIPPTTSPAKPRLFNSEIRKLLLFLFYSSIDPNPCEIPAKGKGNGSRLDYTEEMQDKDIWDGGCAVVLPDNSVNQLYLNGPPSILLTVSNPEGYEELFNTGLLPDDFSLIETPPPPELQGPHKLNDRLRSLYTAKVQTTPQEKTTEQDSPTVEPTYPRYKSRLRIIYDRARWDEYKAERGFGRDNEDLMGDDSSCLDGPITFSSWELRENEKDAQRRARLRELMADKNFIALYRSKLQQMIQAARKKEKRKERCGGKKSKTSGEDSAGNVKGKIRRKSHGENNEQEYSSSTSCDESFSSDESQRAKKVKIVKAKAPCIKPSKDKKALQEGRAKLKEEMRRKSVDKKEKIRLAKKEKAAKEGAAKFDHKTQSLLQLLGDELKPYTSVPAIKLDRSCFPPIQPILSAPELYCLERRNSFIPVKYKVPPLKKARRIFYEKFKEIKSLQLITQDVRERLDIIFKAARRASVDYTAMEEVKKYRRKSMLLREKIHDLENRMRQAEHKERVKNSEIVPGPHFFEEELRQSEPPQKKGKGRKKKSSSGLKLLELLVPEESSTTQDDEEFIKLQRRRLKNSRSRLCQTSTYKKRKQKYFQPRYYVIKYRRMYRELQKEMAKKYAELTFRREVSIGKEGLDQAGIMKPRREQSPTKINDGSKRVGSTMTFCLSSRKAYEAGWVVEREDYEADRASLLAWMSNRIKGAVKQKEQEEEVARKSGHRKPSFIRYYGDSRRDQLKKLYEKPSGRERATKSRKLAVIPQIISITEQEDRGDKLMVQLADGSITVHYPTTGEIAIVASAVSGSPGQLYVNCFDKQSDRACLGTFTPTGKACCYRSNGIPGLLLTDEGGIIKSDADETIKRWVWPPNPKEKLCEPISYQLNKEMHVNIRGKRQMTLIFSSHRETVKIQVGVEKEVTKPEKGLYKDGKRRIQPAIKKQGKSPKIEELKRDLCFASKSFELDQRAEGELHKMQEHAKQVVENWMENYRQTLGIPPPEMNKITEIPQVKTPYRRSNSANVPVFIINQLEEKEKIQSFRCPSAPLQHSFRIKQNDFLYTSSPKTEAKKAKKKKKPDESLKEKPSKSSLNEGKSFKKNVDESLPENLDVLFSQISEKRSEATRSTSKTSTFTSSSSTISACDLLEFSSQLCPVITRMEIENIVSKHQAPHKVFKCRCSKNKIPSVHDLELDYFLSHVIPKHQMVVIYITNSLYPECHYYEKMLESIYIVKNKNRSIPCLQSQKDEYRILCYDLAIANQTARRSIPLLLARHNVVPGMTLIYCGSKLLFANSIFNGYGTTKLDFLKQISLSSRQKRQKCYLPSDYRFQPAQGEAGPRMPWGGVMGGVGVDGKGNPGLLLSSAVGDLRQSKAMMILNTSPPMQGITSHANPDNASTISSKTSFPKVKDPNMASYSVLSEYTNTPQVEAKQANKTHKKKNNNSTLPYIESFVFNVS